MHYNGIISTSSYPNETIRVLLDGEPNFIINSKSWIRFDSFSKRFNSSPNSLFFNLNPSSQLINSEGRFSISLPSTSSLDWNISDQNDSFLSLYLSGTNNGFINIIPTRIIPTLSVISTNQINGTIRIVEPNVILTNESVEDNPIGNSRVQQLYLQETGTPITSSVYISAGPLHKKTRIDNSNYFTFSSQTSSINGSVGKFSDLNFYTTLVISGEDVKFHITQTPNDPNLLWSLPVNPNDNYCGYSGITGTCDPNSGEFVLNFLCGLPKIGSKLEANFISINESDISSSLTLGGSTPNFTLTTTDPIYLYDFDIKISPDDIDYYHGFSMVFDAYGLVENNNTSEVKVSPRVKSEYGATMNISNGHSIWRVTLLSGEPSSLSAVKSDYTTYNIGDWLPASVSNIYFADADGVYDTFWMNLEISSTNGQIWDDTILVATNSGAVELGLSSVGVSEDKTTYQLRLNSDIEIPDGYFISFNIDPNPNGTILKSCDGSSIPLDSPVLINKAECISAIGVGPGTTVIDIYSTYLDLSGSFELESELNINDFVLEIGFIPLNICNLSNSFVLTSNLTNEDGVTFKLPQDGNICWKLSYDSDNMEYNSTNEVMTPIFLDSCLPAFNNSIIMLNATSTTNSQVAVGTDFSIQCIYEGVSGVPLTSNTINLKAQSFPDPSIYNLEFDVISGDDTIIASSNTYSQYPLPPGVHNLKFKFKSPVPYSYDEENITWNIDGTTTDGVPEISANIDTTSEEKVVELYLDNITIAGWGSRTFCLNSSITFLQGSDSLVDFISFPRNKFSGSTLTLQNFNNYTGSHGNTAYDSGHTETFFLSAEPGYSSYRWKIRDVIKTTSSNTTTIPLQGNESDVGESYTIYLSAYSPDYGSGIIPQYGFSDDSTPLKEHVRFLSYPDVSLSASIDTDFIELIGDESEPFNLKISILNDEESPVKVIDGIVEISLSGVDGVSSIDIDINSNNINYFDYFTLNIGDFFSIRPNTFNVFNLCLSADLSINITNPSDFSPKEVSTNMFCIPITAFNGPYLSISPEKYCVPINEEVMFTNTSTSFENKEFENFIFDDGAGNIMYATISDPLTGIYSEAGFYTPKLSAYLDGTLVVKEFQSLIIAGCDQICYDYDENIDRDFSKKLTLPYDLSEIMMKPNEKLDHIRYNSSIDYIQKNIDFITSKCKTYSLITPTKILNQIDIYGLGLDLKQTKFKNKTLFGISNSNTIKIINGEYLDSYNYTKSDRFHITKNDNELTEGEFIGLPIAIDCNFDGSRYAVIDGISKSIYVYDYNEEKSDLVIYFGGPGSRTAKTKFNKPISLKFNNDGELYILDAGGSIVKRYNKYLNWSSNIDHIDFKNKTLTSLDIDTNGNVYIMDSTNLIYVFDAFNKFIKTIQVNDTGYIHCNRYSDDIFYIISDYSVSKYTSSGIRLNQFTVKDKIIGIDQHDSLLYIVTEKIIYVAFDCLLIDTLRDESADNLLWNLDSIRIHKDEPVQDWNYNDSIKKIFDNIDIIRRSIIKKFITYSNPFNPKKTEYELVSIISSEFDDSYISDCPFIGINEFVSYDVFNRVFGVLLNNLKSVLKTIDSKPKNTLQECIDSRCYSWRKLTTNNVLQPNNCSTNPLSWVELKNNNITNWNSLSCEGAISTELENIHFNPANAKNKVPSRIVNCEL